MRLKLAGFLAVCACLGQSALAGAWLREQGTGFASLSFGATQKDETTAALYLEYGLNEKMTIGVDISAFNSSEDVRNGFGILFLRRSLGPTDRPNKFAYEVGLGALYEDNETLPAVKTAVSWGRGFQLGQRNGWVNVDAGYIYEPQLMNNTTKLDATVGLDIGGITTGIVELNLSRTDSDSFSAVEPSLLIKPRKVPFQIKLGAQIPLQEGNDTLKLGIWKSF